MVSVIKAEKDSDTETDTGENEYSKTAQEEFKLEFRSTSNQPPESSNSNSNSLFSPNFDYLNDNFEHPQADSPQLHSLPHNSIQLSSAQQSKLINYLDDQLLQISRKYVKKFSDSTDPESAYSSLDSLLDDMDRLVELIWYSVSVTSTAFIQTQYLLRIADDLGDYLSVLPIQSPGKMFTFLRKLDKIFLKLIVGDIPSHKRMSNTEKARLESIVERTRVDVVSVMSRVSGYEVDITRVYDSVLEELN